MPKPPKTSKGTRVAKAGPLPIREDPDYEYEEDEGDDATMDGAPAFTEEEAFAPDVAERAADTAGLAVGIVTEVAKSKTLLLPTPLRNLRPIDAYWQTDAGKAALRGFDDPGLLLGDLTATMKSVLGEETVQCIQANEDTVRAFFERSNPPTQCGNVIGSAKGQSCWICGTRIIPKEVSFKPECEHVFPIIQALAFTGLYETQLFESLEDQQQGAYTAGLRLEYRWAHRICNQVKNDAHFVVLTRTEDGTAVFGIDDAKIADFLTKLETTTKWGGGTKLLKHLKQETQTDPVVYLRGRVSAIREICSPILEAIASMGLTPAQHARATAMHIKEFVAEDGRCIEEAPPPKIPPTAPGTKDLSQLGTITPADAEVVVAYGLRAYGQPFLNVLLGKVQAPLRAALRAAGKSAAERTRALSDLAAIEQAYLASLQIYIGAEMNTFRQRLYAAIEALPGPAAEKWSKFQVYSNQFIFAFLVHQVATNSKLLVTQVPEELRPFLQTALNDPGVQAAVSTEFTAFLQKLTPGIPDLTLQAVLATPPKAFPTESGTPQFLGGHLGGRRGLYGNARTRPSSSAGGEHDA
jgi:hypothetical protein